MSANSILSGFSNLLLPEKNVEPLPLEEKQKRIVICLYKSFDKDDLLLVQNYGKVIVYSDTYTNIDCGPLIFDYFILDLREEDQRVYFIKYIKNKDYYLILFRYSFEMNNGVSFHNEIDTLPRKQAFKKDFDLLLLNQPIPPPKWYISLFRSCVFGSAQIQI